MDLLIQTGTRDYSSLLLRGSVLVCLWPTGRPLETETRCEQCWARLIADREPDGA
jgi:hypothetical protein